LPPMPEYYRHTLANGKTVMETAPTIEWGYLIYLTVLRLCQYFGAHEECGFCDINHNWRQHKKAGRPYTGVKPVEDVLEALELIVRHDEGATHAYTLTGGSVTSTVDGLAEADFYGRYAQAIEERFPGRWIGKVVAQALPKADVVPGAVDAARPRQPGRRAFGVPRAAARRVPRRARAPRARAAARLRRAGPRQGGLLGQLLHGRPVRRLTVEEARELWLSAEDDELMRLAGEVRARYHEPDRA